MPTAHATNRYVNMRLGLGLKGRLLLMTNVQGVPLKLHPLNFSKCQIVENMAES